MKDLRPTGGAHAPALIVRASAAAELLRLIGVLVDTDQDEYDVGTERIESLRERVGSATLAQLQALDGGSSVAFHVLSLLAADLPDPAGVEELVAALEGDPGLGWRLLLVHHATRELPANLSIAEAAVTGDTAALEEIRTRLAPLADRDAAGVVTLLETTPEDHGRHLLEAINAVRPLWEGLAHEAMEAIARDVDARRAQLQAGTSVRDIVLDATNGYEPSGDPEVRRIVLLPSFWIRPWLVVGRRADAEILTTVVAEEFLVLPARAPSPALLKLFKALGDESRLKLLRRMSSGPVSLTEATAELDVAKATAHHHLAILRQAGLVTVSGEGRGSRYTLRGDPPQAAFEALRAYLTPGRDAGADA
ncbi:MAG: metalloregulator ArsR/SmtB family transcription factor [Nitriliruptoraceae bacterium]